MRGLCRWAQNCGVQNCGEAPSPSLRIADASHRRSCTKYGGQRTPTLSPHAGEVEKANPFSRRASRLFCSSPLPSGERKPSTKGARRVRGRRVVHPPRRFLLPSPACGEGEGARQRSSGSARLSAFHRGSRQRECSSPRLSVRPCFLRLGRSVWSSKPAPTGGRSLAPLRGRYPRRPVPVQRCTSRAGRSAGRHDAQAARERR